MQQHAQQQQAQEQQEQQEHEEKGQLEEQPVIIWPGACVAPPHASRPVDPQMSFSDGLLL